MDSSTGVGGGLERKALVVDDDAGIRLLLKHVLVRNNFDVVLARDGAEAIERLEKPFDINHLLREVTECCSMASA